MALADAICSIFGSPLTLREFVASPDSRDLQVLEINPAGSLNPTLRRLRGHRLVEYPEVDMLKMPYETGTFDLIVHSDTLEHVPDPIAALGMAEACAARSPSFRVGCPAAVMDWSPGAASKRAMIGRFKPNTAQMLGPILSAPALPMSPSMHSTIR
jgi:Methyltransferase domain